MGPPGARADRRSELGRLVDKSNLRGRGRVLWVCMAGEDGGSFLTVTLEDTLFPFCEDGEAFFLSEGEFLEEDPS